MKDPWRIIFSTLLLVAQVSFSKGNCDCALFVHNGYWLPEERVFSMQADSEIQINCTDFGVANERCKIWCEGEMLAMKAIIQKDPTLLQDHPPQERNGCSPGIKETVPFSRACGSQSYIAASSLFGPSLCCNFVSNKNTWCVESAQSSEDNWNFQQLGNELRARKLDLTKDQNDVAINEIEGSGPPAKTSIISALEGKPSSSRVSWIKTALKFFGYTSFGELIRNVDIFSIPGKIKSAVRTYKDELSMGRCYMEFTTFKLFTKEENPFEDLLRKKRSSLVSSEERDTDANMVEARSARANEIKNFLTGITGLLNRNEETRQYASMLTTFLPILAQMYSGGESSSSGSIAPMLINMVGPLLNQFQSSSRPIAANPVDKVSSINSHDRPNPSSSSPVTSMAIGIIGNLVKNFLSSQTSNDKVGAATPVVNLSPTNIPSAPSQSQSPPSSGLGSIVNLLLGGLSNRRPPLPVAAPVTKPPRRKAPPRQPPRHPALLQQDNAGGVDKENKSFVSMMLEVIRPIFISIMGNTPGESGVKAIRRVSTLSTLGRVDDTLREEVDSPFFCFKKYVVNKAWTVTESGLRTVVTTFSPEDRVRMERMLGS